MRGKKQKVGRQGGRKARHPSCGERTLSRPFPPFSCLSGFLLCPLLAQPRSQDWRGQVVGSGLACEKAVGFLTMKEVSFLDADGTGGRCDVCREPRPADQP